MTGPVVAVAFMSKPLLTVAVSLVLFLNAIVSRTMVRIVVVSGVV